MAEDEGTEYPIHAAPPADEPLSAEEAQELRALSRGPFITHTELKKRLAARRA